MVRTLLGSSIYSGAFYEVVGGTAETKDSNGNPAAVTLWPDTLPYDQSHQFYSLSKIVGATVMHFEVWDETAPVHRIVNADVSVKAGTAQYFGDTADAVQERGIYSGTGGVARVMKYEAFTGSQGGGSNLFSRMNALLNGSWVNFNTQIPLTVIMHDNTTNTTLDSPSGLSSQDTFTTNRKGCGTDERYSP